MNMAIADVIKFGGTADDLVWKYSGEEFNVTSQLIVDETHQALLVVNGQAADLFGAGRHTLSVPNIPILKKIISIPTGGTSPFNCKVFYITQVHQMDVLWGTQGAITLNDPLYEIFLHVMLHGSMTFSIVDSRKFLIKMVGFRSRYSSNDLVSNFRGIISSNVKDCISKIMINGKLSYFDINANLFDISNVVKSRLDDVFDEYGIKIEIFNIETIEVPENDYEAITKAKERRAGRIIEGYSWQEERQMDIAQAFAGNEGTMGNIGGAVGGFMMGGAFGGTVTEIAKNALDSGKIPSTNPPGNVAQANGSASLATNGFNVNGFFDNNSNLQNTNNTDEQPSQPEGNNQPKLDVMFCSECGAKLAKGAKFCSNCGAKQVNEIICPKCGKVLQPDAKFCCECGTKIENGGQ